MEIWKKSRLVESSDRLIASQTQSRTHVVEVPCQPKVSLSSVDFGEMLLTVIKGKGVLHTREGKEPVERGDQVFLIAGDEFALSAAAKDSSFVVQMYCAQSILDFLS